MNLRRTMGKVASGVLLLWLAFDDVAIAADPDPCRLVTPAEIVAAVGGKPAAGKAGRPDVDPETKARSWSCDYQLSHLFVSINVAEFTAAAGAAAEMSEILRLAAEGSEGMKLVEVPGPGERSIWGASNEGAMWIVRKGRYVFNVTVAGELNDPASLREPLRRLTAQGLARL